MANKDKGSRNEKKKPKGQGKKGKPVTGMGGPPPA